MMLRVITGECREGLLELEPESVQCCVTSPPYWGLRDYGTAKWNGGDDGCDHVSHEIRTGLGMAALGEQYRGGGHKASEPKPVQFNGDCGKCGARRIDSQIGLEKTPQEYVEKIVEVMREVRRVLKKDGTLWLNLGDSYNSIGHKKSHSGFGTTGLAGGIAQEHSPLRRENSAPGLKHKDLVGIPWAVAFALRADGWWLRQDIIWAKPNPMPESVTDRCTKAHEYIFLLTKSPRYFYDADAIRERSGDWHSSLPGRSDGPGQDRRSDRPRDALSRSGNKERKPASARGVPIDTNGSTNGAVAGSIPWEGDIRNRRSVWTVTTRPYSDAHFATFPPALITPCILAGSRPGDLILDPFAGSGTTGQVALELGRRAVLIELNPNYAKLIEQRTTTTIGLPLGAGLVPAPKTE